jgi:hypothetical protein
MGRPVSIAIDPAAARAAYEAAPSPSGSAALLWAFVAMGCVELGIAASSFAHQRPFAVWSLQLLLGVLWPIQGVLQGRRKRPAFPLSASFSDAGISFELRGTSRPSLTPWQRVRSIANTPDAFSITIAQNAIVRRTYSVPKPADPAIANEILALSYRHLVAPRGLTATPLERLGIIANTAQ